MLNTATAWRATFQALRQDFQKAADAGPTLRHCIVEPLENAGPLPPHLEKAVRASNATTGSLMTAPWDERRRFGYLYGPATELGTFERLAERAWLALPGTPDGKAQAYPQMRPLER